MTAYECDRCGALFKRNCVPKTTITIDRHPNGEVRKKPFTVDYSMRTISGNWLPRKDGDV